MEVEHGHHGPRRSVDPLSVAMVANPRRVGGIVLADYTLGTIIVSMSCFFLFSEETGMLQVDWRALEVKYVMWWWFGTFLIFPIILGME